MSNFTVQAPQRQTVARQLAKRVGELADLAEIVAKEADVQLSSVTLPIEKIDTDTGKIPAPDCLPEETWPPLFAELRDCLNQIHKSLIRIRRTIERTEL